jgi:outer membrane protein assembly factor BamA
MTVADSGDAGDLLRIIFYFIFFFVITAFADEQEFSGKTITSILVIGNEETKEDVITREMLLNIGDTFNDSLRVLSERRITNLFLFNDVEIIPVPDNQNLALLVKVTERLFIFPFPEVRIEDRDWKKLTYGIGLAHINFRGRNEKLFGIALFGYRPGFQIDYYNPWIGEKNRYTSRISIRKYNTDHKVLNLSEDHFFTSWTLGKYWDRYLFNQLTISYENVQIPKNDFKNNTAVLPVPSNNYEDDIAGISLSLNYDTRDLIVYPSQGWYARIAFDQEGLFNPQIDYSQYFLELRHYKSVGPFVLAGRAFTLQTLGTLPVHRYIYLGFDERIRGHFSKIKTGQHLLIGNFETRFHLISLQKYNFPSLFLPQSSTQNLKFGLDGALFFDTGVVWGNDLTDPEQTKKERMLKNQKALSGFGAALRFRLPYIELARLEYAFNENLKSEIIFEIGISF